MRYSDLISLALSALWQQKLRSTLTILGVVFGSFVLLASLSVRDGVHQRVVQEHARFRELREIQVYPGQRLKGEPPPDELDVRGDMSEAKRQRLHDEIRRRWEWSNPQKARVALNDERLKDLRRLPHVRALRPNLALHGRAKLGDAAEFVMGIAVVPEDARFADRMMAGTQVAADDANQVVVSEHLLYKLGVADDAQVAGTLGKRLSLEFRASRPSPSFLLTLLAGQSARAEAKDEELLDKVLAQLPAAIPLLDLSAEERAAFTSLLQSRPKTVQISTPVMAEEFTICGVMRSLPREPNRPGDWQAQNADLLVPAAALARFMFQHPELAANGYESVTVEVDEIAHVKGVAEQIKSTDLMCQALVEVIEREQTIYALIFSAMTVVAIVGLLVSGLGITNTTLMSVLERVREIGIMKAVGARDGHILTIFLIEGTLIGLAGGIAGTLLGWVASHPADAWVHSMVQRDLSIELHGTIFAFPWWLVLGVPVFATLVTTLAALFPARRAAQVNPVAALRHE